MSSSEIKYEKLLKFGNQKLSTADVPRMLNSGFSSKNPTSFQVFFSFAEVVTLQKQVEQNTRIIEIWDDWKWCISNWNDYLT